MLKGNGRTFLRSLADEYGGRMLFDEPLKGHTTVSIGGPADVLYMPSTPEELSELVTYLKKENLTFLVLGNGSNVLIPDTGIRGVVISLKGTSFDKKIFEGNSVAAGAGLDLSVLISDSCAHGLSGLEGLIGIPGTVGGAIATNASYKSPVSEHLVKVRVLAADGKIKWLDKKDIEFTYRASSLGRDVIILEALFDLSEESADVLKERMQAYFKEKIETQPLEGRTLGCVFRNPPGSGKRSWELIDMCGMRGRSLGGVKVSEKHANFLINTGGGTSGDFMALVNEIHDAVKEKFSVDLEPEIEIW